jgi:hypothetical protein
VTEYRRVCWRCDEPIQPGDEADVGDVFSPTGAGPIVELHYVCPVRVPKRQKAPVGFGAPERPRSWKPRR